MFNLFGGAKPSGSGNKRKREEGPAPAEETMTTAPSSPAADKNDPWGGGSITGNKVTRDWVGNFIVLGTTGSGKTTLCRYMTTEDYRELATGEKFEHNAKSVTKEGVVYKSGLIHRADGSTVKLQFRDTVGFGANDMKSEDILKSTLLEVLGDFDKIRACIFVHKCERYREGGNADITKMKRAMKTMGLEFKNHLLLVITNTAHLSDETKNAYSKQVSALISGQIPPERVVHVNFANLAELNEYHRQFFRQTAKGEVDKLMQKLMLFTKEVAPLGKQVVDAFSNHYDKETATTPASSTAGRSK